MREYALISADGTTILDHVFEDDSADPYATQNELHPGKPYYLPVVVTQPTYDPVSQVIDGVAVETITATQVTRTWNIRAKNADEIAAMKSDKQAEIDAQFGQRTFAPISYTPAGGTAADFETDDTARKRINATITLMQAGKLPSPVGWAVYNSVAMVNLTTDDMLNLAAAIAVREQQLFQGNYATLTSQLAALSDPTQINALDPTTGW